MKSHLLTRLEAEIAQARDPVQRELLCAERVALLARSGRLDEARRDIEPLRRRHQLRPDPATAAGLGLADAMIDYYSDLGGQARVKLQRARVLAGSAQRPSLQALCAAWLAHLEYVHDDVPALIRHAAQALALAAPDHHAARSRASLVVAMAYHHAGRVDRAQPWYAAARRHASAEGDAATLSALMHNMAALRASLARLATLFGDEAQAREQAEQALSASVSSLHYDAHVGGCALPVLQPILRAQLLVTQQRYAEALVLFEAHFAEAVASGLGRVECSLRADVACCRARLGQPALAREQAVAAVAALRPDCHVDDLALAHGRLAQVQALLGDAAAAQHHSRLAQQYAERYRAEQALLVEQLDRAFVAPGH